MSRLVTGVAEAQQRGPAGDASSRSYGLAREFAASGISVGCANTILNPVEVIKTRMQLNGAGPSAQAATSAATAAARHAAVAPHALAFTPAAAAAAAGSASASSSAASASAAASFLQPNSSRPSAHARFFSHTAAYRGVIGGSTTAAAAAGSTAAINPSQLLIPTLPAAEAAAAAAAAASATAKSASDAALATSLQAATAAITNSSSIGSRVLHQHTLLPGLNSSSSSSINATTSATTARPGFVGTARLILREEGPTAFTRGIQASATRAVLNGGIRLGLYDPIKTLMSVDGSGRDLHMGQKLAAGSISGCIGAVCTTPIELAKTRLQAPSATTRSMSAVLRSVVQQQGVRGLWRGATPSVLRLILLNSSMVATYDEVKGHIRALTGWPSGLPLVLSSSMVAGLVTTTVINPADVARAYMQTGRGNSLVGVARDILAREGPRGFLKGWSAAYCRTGPQTLIIFTVSELVRPLFGLNVIGGSG